MVADIPLLDHYPYLDQILTAYLHSDYTINGPELADSVAAYARDGGWLQVVAARADIQRFLAYKRDNLDSELARLSHDHAHEPDQNAAEFLRWLDETLAKHQAAGDGPQQQP